MNATARASAHATLAAGSKSFALAGKLLPARCRDDAAVLYAWCRRCDDAIDLAPPAERAGALQQMRRELEQIYRGETPADPALAAFAEVVRRCQIPSRYPTELLDGFEMDVDGVQYDTLPALLGYAYRVAGTVGVMMARLMGAMGMEPLRRAAHLGIAMQLTNICRDVEEDWHNRRLYLPADLVQGQSGPALDPQAVAGAIQVLLHEAAVFYASGERGLAALRFRCAVAIRAARLIYADIGRVIAAQGHDYRRGRAVVSRPRKLWLVARAFVVETAERARCLLGLGLPWSVAEPRPTPELEP